MLPAERTFTAPVDSTFENPHTSASIPSGAWLPHPPSFERPPRFTGAIAIDGIRLRRRQRGQCRDAGKASRQPAPVGGRRLLDICERQRRWVGDGGSCGQSAWGLRRRELAGITGAARRWTVAMISGCRSPADRCWRSRAGHARAGARSPPLERLVGHLNRVRVAQLMRGQALAHGGIQTSLRLTSFRCGSGSHRAREQGWSHPARAPRRRGARRASTPRSPPAADRHKRLRPRYPSPRRSPPPTAGSPVAHPAAGRRASHMKRRAGRRRATPTRTIHELGSHEFLLAIRLADRADRPPPGRGAFSATTMMAAAGVRGTCERTLRFVLLSGPEAATHRHSPSGVFQQQAAGRRHGCIWVPTEVRADDRIDHRDHHLPGLHRRPSATRALWPSARIVSTIDSAVSGLMNSAAPSAALRSSGSSTMAVASATR